MILNSFDGTYEGHLDMVENTKGSFEATRNLCIDMHDGNCELIIENSLAILQHSEK